MGATGAPAEIETRLFINGKFVESSDGGKFALTSPATHEAVAHVSEATEADANAAVAAAKAAFPSWSKTGAAERGSYLRKLAALTGESLGELAKLEALSIGKPVSTFFEGAMAVDELLHWSEAGFDAKGETSLNTPGFVNMTLRQPAGVVAIIIPWNIPMLFFAERIGAALAAGCTVVLKSSEKAPLTSAKMATLVAQVGFPPGVINVLSGHGTPSGSTLASHMDVRVINFTGSLATGRKIQAAAAASNLKNVILELGGKSPVLIFPDADLDDAAHRTQLGIGILSGQGCVCNSRIYVHESVAADFIARFKREFAAAMRIGNPLDATTTQGPQADKIQYDRVLHYLALARDSVAAGKGETAMGGNATQHDGKGYYIEPTVFTDLPEDSVPMREEIFGPVVGINTFSSEADGIAKANDTHYGLYASVFTRDTMRALRVAKALDAGMVGVNATTPTAAPDMPFGGYKASGIGRGGYGYSLESYLETKAVYLRVDEEAMGHTIVG